MALKVEGLRELTRAFDKFDRDLVRDLKDELAEAANPVKLVTQEQVASMEGVAKRSTNYWSAMRIGVTAKEVYVVPAWRSNKGTPQGARLKGAIFRRMERAVDEKSDEVEDRIGDFLDTLASDWGRGA